MLTRRLQTLVSVRDRAAHVRSYFAGFRAQPNLKSPRYKTTSETITSTEINVPICTSRRFFGGIVRNDRIITRPRSTTSEDEPCARPNLKSRRCKTSEEISFSKKSVPVYTSRRWFGGIARNDRIITRALPTTTDDDPSARPNLKSPRCKTTEETTLTKNYVPTYTSRRWFCKDVTNDCTPVDIDTPSDIDPSMLAQESENNYARKVVATSKHDVKSIGAPLETIESVTDEEAEKILGEDWTSASAEEALEAFRKLSCHAKVNDYRLNDEKHKNILSALTSKLSEMSDEQMRQIYQCCLIWSDIKWSRCVAYTNLITAMDSESLMRLTGWTVDEAFLMCDYLFQLRLARKQNLPMIALKKFGNKPKRMNPGNLLHFMFLINVCRKPPINMYEIEYRFDKIIDEYTADELSVFAMGFFKSQTPLRDHKIVVKMQKKLLEAIDTVHDISFSAIMKITRYSAGLKDLKIMEDILEAVKPRVPELTIPCLVHLAHAAAFVQLHNPETMQLIIDRFLTDIESARLKDLERFTWVLSIYNCDAKLPIYEKIVESLRDPRRADEIERFATILPTTMMNLSNVGIFPVDLIKTVFDPEFLDRVYKKNVFKIGWSHFSLESNIRTELPDYEGPFLSDNVRRYLAKKHLTDLMATKPSQVHPSDKLVLEVAHMCKLALGSETAIHIDHILPHFLKSDIVICLDEKNEPVAPGPILSTIPNGTIKRPPPEAEHLKWIAIVLATQNQMIRNTDRYIGPMVTKLRQLRKLNYHPIVVTHIQWRSLPNLEAKENYLRSILPPSAARKITVEAV